MLPLAFGFSPPDIGIILVLALIVFGPKKLPEVGKQIGQAMRELRKVTDELTGAVHSVHSEVESVYRPILAPPQDYSVNTSLTTSSVTVEKAITQRPYDQSEEDLAAPKDLMTPFVTPIPRTEAESGIELKGN